MDAVTFPLLLVLLLVLGAEFVNGWTDSPNSVATVISTRALPPGTAVLLASILNLVGVLSGTAVAMTISKGIVDPKVIDLVSIAGAMIGIIAWSTLTARWGIPTSESHALIAGLAGAGLASGGFEVLLWEGWKKVLIGLFFSSAMGMGLGFVLMVVIYWICRNASLGKAKGPFRGLQILAFGVMAFSHGQNDGQKFMGIFALALVVGGVSSASGFPLWVVFVCAACMALGTMVGGWRIIKTMGFGMTKLDNAQGFAAQLGAGSTIIVASIFGIPLSTTHTINTAIMGVGAVRRLSAVRWGVTLQLVVAWALTFPICALISFGTVKLLRKLV